MLEYYNAQIKSDYKMPCFEDFWFTIVTMVILVIIEKLITEIFYSTFYSLCKEKTDERMRHLRTLKACKYLFKGWYMTSASLIGYYTLKDSFILPPELGGNGSLYNTFLGFPEVPLPQLYKLYFTGTMGYHASGLISILLAKEKANDYVEMMFHHLVTFYLYGFSFLSNLAIGGVIAFLHDITDIFVSFTRVVSETEYKNTTAIMFTWTIIVWVYTRLYVFSMCIYVPIWKLEIYGVSPYLKPIFGYLLICLLILHIYWFFLCVKILLSFFHNGKAEDLANQIKDTRKKDNATQDSNNKRIKSNNVKQVD